MHQQLKEKEERKKKEAERLAQEALERKAAAGVEVKPDKKDDIFSPKDGKR